MALITVMRRKTKQFIDCSSGGAWWALPQPLPELRIRRIGDPV